MEKVKELDKEIKEALREFGRYSYFDKGAEEVMLTDKWVSWVEGLSREDAIEFGKYLVEHDKKDCRYDHFIETALYNAMPDMWDEGIREQREGTVGLEIELQPLSLEDVMKRALK